jgi:hypothetical protein
MEIGIGDGQFPPGPNECRDAMSRGERLLDQRNAGGASGAEDAQFHRSPPNEAAAVPTLLLAWAGVWSRKTRAELALAAAVIQITGWSLADAPAGHGCAPFIPERQVDAS